MKVWCHQTQETDGDRQKEWLLYRVRVFYTERWRGSEYACLHAVRITEGPSVQYKNNCEYARTNVQICVCVCARGVIRARGHRRIKQRQKDEHLAGLGRIEG